jgi:hypothetical protein
VTGVAACVKIQIEPRGETMMRNIRVLLLSLALCFTVVLVAASASAEPRSCNDWNLVLDYLRTSDQTQPVQSDPCGQPVWFFMNSASLNYDPASYIPLPAFFDSYVYCTPGTGIKRWMAGPDAEPEVILNALGQDQACHTWAPITLKTATVHVHPSPSSAAVVGWKSPVQGTVQVEINLADRDPNGGDGVDWFVQHVQKNRTTMPGSGVIVNGGSASWLRTLSVKAGDILYFGFGPGPAGDYYYDSTALDITITHIAN